VWAKEPELESGLSMWAKEPELESGERFHLFYEIAQNDELEYLMHFFPDYIVLWKEDEFSLVP